MFVDREEAGQRLADVLKDLDSERLVVVALPRGGVVVGAEIAYWLNAPLDVLLVRKIGHPFYSEYAIGAVAEGQEPVYDKRNDGLISKEWRERAVSEARALIKRRHKRYFQRHQRPILTGKTVIIADDGMATGLTMKAAALAVQQQHPRKIVIAVPVASSESVDITERYVDELVVLEPPTSFKGAVGAHYHDFREIYDEDVVNLLEEVDHAVHKTASK